MPPPSYRLSEVKVLKYFASICPYKISSETIEQRQPPEPDAICQLFDGSWLAFEITQSIDQNKAKRDEDSQFMKSFLKDCLDKSQFKDSFNDRFKNAMIFIYPINRQLDRRYFMKNAGEFLSYIMKHGTDKEEFILPGKIKFKCEIDRGSFIRPYFNTDYGSDFHDNTINKLKDKFKNTYITVPPGIPIDLLVFYYMQPVIIPWEIEESLEFIMNNIGKSPFQRVWLYSINDSKIVGYYPEV